MNFTLENVFQSIAGVLKREYPDCDIYVDPEQQGTTLPCFFIFPMQTTIKGHISDRYFRDIGVDVVYLQSSDTLNRYRIAQEIVEYLDQSLDTFSYSDGSGTTSVRALEREWSIDDGELHYKFHIKVRVAAADNHPKMESLVDINGGIK